MAYQPSGPFWDREGSDGPSWFDDVTSHQGSSNFDRHKIWWDDLQSIRRETPVVDKNQYQSVQVEQAAPGQGTAPSANPGKTSETSTAQSSKIQIIDDDDSDGEGKGSAADLLTFYGQKGASQAAERIKYQDQNLAHQGIYPSRRNGLGFDMARLRRDNNWADTVGTVQDAEPTWDQDMYMANPPLGFDEAVSRNWAQDAHPDCLRHGFPLVENVDFYRPRNYDGARSACFFKALGYLVYGNHTFYMRVQAEHLQYYGDVLEWEDHPRHQLYKRMNKKFYNTQVSTPTAEVPTIANFFQLLSIPQIWMPLDMLDVTADLYNLFIVVYTIERNIITEVSTKGSYNARHVFLLFNGDHYQPMVPNEYLASEFTFPRVTYHNVKSLPWSGNTDRDKSSIDLRWRRTWGPALDRKMGALPVDHVFYKETLRTAMTGTYQQQ
ncbi:hypothetical protein F5883DRAFT_694014 [Diaporthe sp. PMI_573]|nr:hypothetical protein F5883DRAFT_694014 [Diaporthaceae sp. PMI_573]